MQGNPVQQKKFEKRQESGFIRMLENSTQYCAYRLVIANADINKIQFMIWDFLIF